MNYTITRNRDGTLTVQRPNHFNGLYPLVMPRDKVFTLEDAFSKIATDALDHEILPGTITIEVK